MENARPFQKLKMKHRPGFDTRTMRWIYRIVYPYFHCRVNIPPELQDREEPVVFIANHYNVFGPASFMVSVPVVSNVWINSELVEQESAEVSLRSGIKKMLPFLSDGAVAKLCAKIASFAVWALTRFGVIPVDRNQPSKLIATMRRSIEALEAGHNLLIFPETGLPEYSLISVTPFYSGFAMLGKLYHRKTGKKLQFCPCYIDEQHHLIRMGELVTYEPEADSRTETERVSDELNLRIREMAAEHRGVEKEKSTPIRQTILFFCNAARLLLLIPLIVMLGLGNVRMILLFYLISQGIRILFNVVCNTYVSSNRLAFLFSHAMGILTDVSMLSYLAMTFNRLRWLLYALILNGIVILVSNIRTTVRYRRCAGVNYFDTLSANLLFVICLQQLLQIRVSGLVVGAMTLSAMVFLACSAGSAIGFNARIGREEDWDHPV